MKDHQFDQKRILFWVLTLGVLVWSFLIFWPFVSALLWATVLSILMHPFYARINKRMSAKFSALIATMITGFVIVLPFAGLGTVVGIQVYDFANKLIVEQPSGSKGVTVEQIAVKVDDVLKPILAQIGLGQVDVRDYIDTHRNDLVGMVRGPLSKLIASLGATILTLVIALLTMYFMLIDGHKLLNPVCEIIPIPRSETIKIFEKMTSTVRAVFVSVVLVSIIQATIAGVTYWLVGVPSPLLWAVVTFVFCTIPLLGAPVIYVPLALKLIAEGNIGRGLILIFVGFGIVSVIDNFLRPFFIGARSSLHPMAVFFALLGGVLLLGPVGIMAGPMVVTLLIGIFDILRALNSQDLIREGEPDATPAT